MKFNKLAVSAIALTLTTLALSASNAKADGGMVCVDSISPNESASSMISRLNASLVDGKVNLTGTARNIGAVRSITTPTYFYDVITKKYVLCVSVTN